jgi:nitrogen fixation NifU-like protein
MDGLDDLYREELLDHWRASPHRGRLEQPDAVGEGMNPLCGDAVRLEFQLDQGRIIEVKCDGDGCVISQAAASILAGLVTGKTVDEARVLDRQALLDALGVTLSPARLKCALLGLFVLRQALALDVS